MVRGQWAYAGERGRASPGWVEGRTGWRAVGCSTRNFSPKWIAPFRSAGAPRSPGGAAALLLLASSSGTDAPRRDGAR